MIQIITIGVVSIADAQTRMAHKKIHHLHIKTNVLVAPLSVQVKLGLSVLPPKTDANSPYVLIRSVP